MIPTDQKTNNDVVDLIVQSLYRKENVKQDDGSFKEELQLDPESAYWKLHLINSPTFGRFVYEFKNLEDKAFQAIDNMTEHRGIAMAKQILGKCKSIRYSIDAKSSETQSDKNNTRASLIDKLGKNKQERLYTVKGEKRKSILDGIFGRDPEEEE